MADDLDTAVQENAVKTATVKFSELGNDWRAGAHVKLGTLSALQLKELEYIDKMRGEYLRRIEKLNRREREILSDLAFVPVSKRAL
jgi:hypothetical protein